MCGFLLRIVINALLVFGIVMKLPGVFIDTLGGAILGVAIIGLANAAVRPLLKRTRGQINWQQLLLLTLGLNLLVSMLIVRLLPGYQVYSLTAPVSVWILATLCSSTLTRLVQDR